MWQENIGLPPAEADYDILTQEDFGHPPVKKNYYDDQPLVETSFSPEDFGLDPTDHDREVNMKVLGFFGEDYGSDPPVGEDYQILTQEDFGL